MYDVLVSQSIAAKMLNMDNKTLDYLVYSEILESRGNGGFERLVCLSSVFKNKGKKFLIPPKTKIKGFHLWRDRLKKEAIESGYVDLPFKAMSDGYWVLLDRYKRPKIKEHRHVIQKHYGIKLKPDQVIHHKNGIKIDNEVSNLQIMSASQHVRLKKRKNLRK